MIDSNIILFIIYVFGAFTLYHTYQNDFNVFLLTSLLALGAFWCYLYINESIDRWENKIGNIEKTVRSKIDFLTNKLFNPNQVMQDIQNLRTSNE